MGVLKQQENTKTARKQENTKTARKHKNFL